MELEATPRAVANDKKKIQATINAIDQAVCSVVEMEYATEEAALVIYAVYEKIKTALADGEVAGSELDYI